MDNLLQSVIQDLQLATYSPRTVEAYSYHVKKFLEYFNKDPKLICEDEIKRYFLYLKYKKKLRRSDRAYSSDRWCTESGLILCKLRGPGHTF